MERLYTGIRVNIIVSALLFAMGMTAALSLSKMKVCAQAVSENDQTVNVENGSDNANNLTADNISVDAKPALAAVRIKKVTVRSKTAFIVTIGKVKGAGGYYVYDRSEDGNLNKLATVKENYNKSFVVKGLKYGHTYHLVVQAYKKNKKTGDIVKGAVNNNSYKKKLKVKSKYKKGLKYFYDADGKMIKDVEHLLPKKKKYMIKVNTLKCVMTIYAKDGKKGYTIPVKSFLCSPSNYTASGTFRLGEKYRYRSLFYNSYSQWTAVIHNPILFHTTPYKSYGSNNSLDVKEYNKLGTAASHGCVRLPCVAVKWIYDNCPGGTKVVIYRSKKAGPFGKPKLTKIPKWHTWDPTDPTAKKKCRKHGCTHGDYFGQI